MNKESFEDYGIHGVNYNNGGNQTVKCPKCSHERKKKHLKDLSVNVGKGSWNCHHCGWAGYLKEKKDSFPNYKVETPIVRPNLKSQTNLTDKEIGWFRNRGIRIPTIDRNKISRDNIWMPQTGKKENVICFNYWDGEELINVKYRDGAKNFRQVKDAEKIVYGYNDIKKDSVKECIICEGEIDKLSFEEAGFYNCISVPDGAPNPKSKNLESKFTYLEHCADALERMTKIYIAVDVDEAGELLKDELARRLGKHICYIVKYPQGCKDINEVLIEHGTDVIKKCIEDAEPFPIEDILQVKDFSDEIDMLYNKGFDSGVSVGYNYASDSKMKTFDQLVSFKTSQLMVVTGIPNHGKSNFMENVAMKLSVHHGWKVGIFSPEHYPMSIMFQRLGKIFVGKQFFKSKRYDRMSLNELEIAKKWINDNWYFIRPNDEDFTLDSVLDAARGLILRHGVKMIIIDPWNTIHHRMDGMRETDYIEKALNKINAFKQRYDVFVTIVAHPTKMPKQANGLYEIPSPTNISGSQHWFNKVDIAMTVYRNFEKNDVEVYIQKMKYEHLGQQGFTVFQWNPQNSRYHPKGVEADNAMWLKKVEHEKEVKKMPEDYSLPYADDDNKFDLENMKISDSDLPF